LVKDDPPLGLMGMLLLIDVFRKLHEDDLMVAPLRQICLDPFQPHP